MPLDIARFEGKRSVTIRYHRGVDFLPVDAPLERSAPSRNLRVIRAGLRGEGFRMTLEGLPGERYAVDFVTARKPAEFTGAERIEPTAKGFRLHLAAPADAKPLASGFARFEAGVNLP